MALQKDDGSCAPWLCHYCNALCMDCSAFQAHCLLHLRRPKVRGWVPSREYIWETASSTVEKNAKWQHHSRIDVAHWEGLAAVIWELLERYWTSFLWVIGEILEWENIWEVSERYWETVTGRYWWVTGTVSLQEFAETCVFCCLCIGFWWKKGSKLWFFLKNMKISCVFTKKQMYLSSLLSSF